MTVVAVEDVRACWLAYRNLTREAGMDSQLTMGAECTLGEWEPLVAVEVRVMHGQEHRTHMELQLGPMMRRGDVNTGVTDEHRAPLLPEPSTSEKRGNSSINVSCSAVG